MKKLGIYAVMAVFVGVMSGCLDDDNNYNYKQINDLQGGNFNIENINSGYNLIEGDELVLAVRPYRRYNKYSIGKLLGKCSNIYLSSPAYLPTKGRQGV